MLRRYNLLILIRMLDRLKFLFYKLAKCFHSFRIQIVTRKFLNIKTLGPSDSTFYDRSLATKWV